MTKFHKGIAIIKILALSFGPGYYKISNKMTGTSEFLSFRIQEPNYNETQKNMVIQHGKNKTQSINEISYTGKIFRK